MISLTKAQTAAWRLASDDRTRRKGYVVVALLLAVLCIWPQPYVARAKILPQDSSTVGLSSMLSALGGRLQDFASLLGGKQSVDLYLIVGRSENVAENVIASLKLAGPAGKYDTVRDAKIALSKKVDVHSLTGGVIEIETKSHDPEEAVSLTEAYVSAISQRLGGLGRERIERKHSVVQQRFGEAVKRLARAEEAIKIFRRTNKLADPQVQMGSALLLQAGIEGRLQAKLVELQTLQQFSGNENPRLKAAMTEIAALRAQLGQSTRPNVGDGGPNVAGLTEVSTEYLNLFRDYRFAQALYEAYSRFSEEVAVEEVIAESASDVQIVEAAHIDAWRHYNISAVALLCLLLVMAFFTEIYAPATGIVFSRTAPVVEE